MKNLSKKHPTPFVRRACLLVSATVGFAVLAVHATAQTPPVTVDIASVRSGIAITRKSYDYAPAVMKQGEKYRLWWGGGIAGDFILYAESDSIAGPWHAREKGEANTFDLAFRPTQDKKSFDSLHTCDPSVLLLNGTYYLYYGGLPRNGSPLSIITRIGVATSANGFDGWTRANHGNAIVSPIGELPADWIAGRDYVPGDGVVYAGRQYRCKVATTSTAEATPNSDKANWKHEYGAGQPSVVYPGDGWIYLFFTDTTAPATDRVHRSGVFVVRSTDPTFQTHTEELQSAGWVPVGKADHRTGRHRLRGGASVDAVYSEKLQSFIIAINQARGQTNLYFHSSDLLAEKGSVVLPAVRWSEGPGIARSPEGRALSSGTDDSDRIPFDLIVGDQLPNTTGPNGWDLQHVGYDLIASPDRPR